MILAIRTDSATVELIVADSDGTIKEKKNWTAERRLARELLAELDKLLSANGGGWEQLRGLIVYEGPGSFTGLRIGISVMNTIAYAQTIPIVGESGDDWFASGVASLQGGRDDRIVLPEYGAPARITTPKK